MRILLHCLTLVWLVAAGLGVDAGAASRPQIPLIYCTDLFHPHGDPDDHFDLATIFAIPEFDIRCVILDQGELQLKQPGTVPVAQMNRITGRHVPAVRGLGAKLRQPTDTALDQPPQFQQGVAALLTVLRTSAPPVMIITVGSARDVVAAFNREPALFRAKVGQLMVFIGEASKEDFREWNVQLDPHAYIGLMRSGLPVYWVPCFDGGLWRNNGHASFWQAKHSALLRDAAPQLLQFFIYALEKETAEPLSFLTQPVDAARRERLMAGTRNLWCTAVFGSLAGRHLVPEDGRFVAKSRPSGRAVEQTLRNELFEFLEVELHITDDAVVKYGAHPDARKVMRFAVRDQVNYARGMTEATAHLLASIGKPSSNTLNERLAPAATADPEPRRPR